MNNKDKTIPDGIQKLIVSLERYLKEKDFYSIYEKAINNDDSDRIQSAIRKLREFQIDYQNQLLKVKSEEKAEVFLNLVKNNSKINEYLRNLEAKLNKIERDLEKKDFNYIYTNAINTDDTKKIQTAITKLEELVKENRQLKDTQEYSYSYDPKATSQLEKFEKKAPFIKEYQGKLRSKLSEIKITVEKQL